MVGGKIQEGDLGKEVDAEGRSHEDHAKILPDHGKSVDPDGEGFGDALSVEDHGPGGFAGFVHAVIEENFEEVGPDEVAGGVYLAAGDLGQCSSDPGVGEGEESIVGVGHAKGAEDGKYGKHEDHSAGGEDADDEGGDGGDEVKGEETEEEGSQFVLKPGGEVGDGFQHFFSPVPSFVG